MGSITRICVFLMLTNHGLAGNPLEMKCLRQDLKVEWFVDQKDTPETFLNMVEQFTEMEEDVMLRAGERILEDSSLSMSEFLLLGLRRKSNIFYVALAFFYSYWLFYIRHAFKNRRERFDRFFEPYRGFYLKKILVIIYAALVALLLGDARDTLKWVNSYSDVVILRESHVNTFLKEYDKVIDYTVQRFMCHSDELRSPLDEVKTFHTRIRRDLQRRIDGAEFANDAFGRLVKTFREDCDKNKTGWCGLKDGRQKMNAYDAIETIQNMTYIVLRTDSLEDSLRMFEDIETETLGHLDLGDYRDEVSERLTRLRDMYLRIENLFAIPPPLLLKLIFYVLFVCVFIVVLLSIVSILTIIRGYKHAKDLEITRPIGRLLHLFSVIVLNVAFLSLFWSWTVILFSSAAHSLFLNVLRDKHLEVLGNLNVLATNESTYHINFRNFLNATSDMVIEDVLALNPQKTYQLENNTDTTQLTEWYDLLLLEELPCHNSTSHSVSELCDVVRAVFTANSGPWIEKNDEQFERVFSACQIEEATCFREEFEKNVARTKDALYRMGKEKTQISNVNFERTGDDLDAFKHMHERYRMQMWNDFVVPITHLEAPSIILVIALFGIHLLHVIAVSFIESSRPEQTFVDHYEFYQERVIDRGLYWYNL